MQLGIVGRDMRAESPVLKTKALEMNVYDVYAP